MTISCNLVLNYIWLKSVCSLKLTCKQSHQNLYQVKCFKINNSKHIEQRLKSVTWCVLLDDEKSNEKPKTGIISVALISLYICFDQASYKEILHLTFLDFLLLNSCRKVVLVQSLNWQITSLRPLSSLICGLLQVLYYDACIH